MANRGPAPSLGAVTNTPPGPTASSRAEGCPTGDVKLRPSRPATLRVVIVRPPLVDTVVPVMALLPGPPRLIPEHEADEPG
jgi:hypothetical protein